MSAEIIQKEYSGDIFTYNGIKTDSQAGLYEYSHSRIWTHVVSQFEGQNFFGHTFSMDKIPGGIIFNPNLNIENGDYTWTSSVSPYLGTLKYICGSGKFSYEPTVENIASSLIVHEWLTHGMLLYGDNTLTHRYSYAYVKSCTHLWDSTTDSYKKHNLSMLKHYSEKEPGNIDYSKIYLEYYFGVLLNSIKNIWKK